MVGGTPVVDLPRLVQGLIGARTGDAVFVVPDLRCFSGTTTAYLHPPPQRGHPRDVPLYEVEPAAWLLVSDEESGQRP